jgi:hypothetical protein|tara:strand:- start:2150 stop:2728 length:579 start_codon:yes stop_codon:yes gene_type:complete
MGVVYTDYFQKSKVFLYPLLKLKKGIDFVPEQTFFAWEGVYKPEECKFLCLYNTKLDNKFLKFELDYLNSHPLLEACFRLDDCNQLYVFDMIEYKHDLYAFIKGDYSKFSLKSKDSIEEFFGSVGNISKYVNTFLYPEDYHTDYAEFLDVELSVIEEVHELCTPPDQEKETLIQKVPLELEIFKNKSISLNK